MNISFNKKGFFVITLLLLLLTITLSACSTSPATTEETTSDNKATDQVENKSESNTVTLKVWVQAKQTERYRLENIKSAAEKLNEELKKEGKNTTVVIDGEMDDSGWGDYKQKFVLSAESNKAPDIILSGHEDVAPWSSAGYIVSLDQYIDNYPEFKDVYPSLWDAVTYKDKRWAILQDVEARPIYFRTDYLEQIGWSQEEIGNLPKKIENGEFTLDDLLKVAKEVQDNGIVEKGFGFYHRPRSGGDFYMFYFAFGGEMQDPNNGKLILDKEALLKEYQFFYDSVFKYETTPKNFLGMEWDIWHKSVTSAEAFINQAGTWTVAEWKTKYKVSDKEWENWGYALVPAGELGGKPVTLSHPLVYMIAANSENQELAARVLALATTPELNTKHAVASNHLAILKSQVNVPEYAANKFLTDVTYMLNYSRFLPNHEMFGTYDQAVFRGLSAVEAGQMSPEEAVETVVAELQRQLGDDVIIR